MEVRNCSTQIRKGNSVRGSGGDDAFSRNGAHRGGCPTAVHAVCAFTYGVPTGQLKPNPPGVDVKVWVNKNDQKHAGKTIRNNGNYGHEKGHKGNKHGCDLVPLQRGIINPEQDES